MTTGKQTDVAKERLLEQTASLRADISRELRKQEEEHFANLAGEITDRSEESVADLLVDVNLAEISRDINELRDVEAALERIDRGTYGVCIDCDKDIEQERLNAVPAASRCYDCQTAFEKKDQREHHRTL
jgi:RNA polymerase-binding transcription factor DksA